MEGFKFNINKWQMHVDGAEDGSSESSGHTDGNTRRTLSPPNSLGSLFDSPYKPPLEQLTSTAGIALQPVHRQLSGSTMNEELDGYENILDVGYMKEAHVRHVDDISDELKVFTGKATARVDAASELVVGMKEVTHSLLDNIEKDVVSSIVAGWHHNSIEEATKSVEEIFTQYKALFHLPTGFSSILAIPSTSAGGMMYVKGVEGGLSDSGYSCTSSITDREFHHHQPQKQHSARSLRKRGRNVKNASPTSTQLSLRLTGGSNSPAETLPDDGDVFKNILSNIDVRAVFERSEDSRMVWKELEANRDNNTYFTRRVKDMDPEEGKIEKDFVRIVGYELMLTERGLGRNVTATERRDFMNKVLDALPIRLRLERYANFTSKGKLDMFVRNKRHYQSRKYGISTSTQMAIKKRT